MFRRAVTAIFVLASFAALAVAQTKPNFSGTWKLNVAKSDFGVLPGQESQTDIIDHNDPALKVATSSSGPQGSQNFTLSFTTDGKEVTNQVMSRDVKSTVSWEGSTLVVASKLKYEDQDIAISSVWAMGADGKTFTQSVHLASPMGETDQKLVFDKQDGTMVTAAPSSTPPKMPATTASAAAGPRPDFSGKWKLNMAKSDFGVVPAPESESYLIVQTEPGLKVTVDQAGQQGKLNYTLDFPTNGTETANQIGPMPMKSTASWDGSALVITGKFKYEDQDVAMKGRWTVSADGKTLTEDISYTSAMGDAEQKLIFDRQEGGTGPAAMVTPSGTKPNFSGVWKLNASKSDFGVMPGPDMRTDMIEHNEPALKLSRKENGPDGARQYVISMTTDGKETVNNLGGADAKVIANWEGDSLVVSSKLKLGDQDVAIKQVSTLSADGKTLTNKAHISMSMGEMDQTEVYERQP